MAGSGEKAGLRHARQLCLLLGRFQRVRLSLGAIEDILQIAGGSALPLDGFPKLAIEGGEFVIERLQFFL